MNRCTVWVATLGLLSCGGPTGAPPSAAPTSNTGDASISGDASPVDAGIPSPVMAKGQDAGSPKERLMRSHFKETREVRDAVIRGDLAATALPIEHMSAMAERDDVPEAWRTPLEHFRVVTRRLGRTSDIPGAAAAVADIGAACGSCHQTTGGPKPKLDAPPSATGTLAGRMQRHVWATERLWEGLYAPSDTSWKAGVDALSVEPFPKEVVERGGVHSRSYVTRFQTLVTTAATAQKVDDRAKVYASLLETCAACHKVTRPSK